MSARRLERVLVVGASRGIGRAIALHLALEGRSVVALARDRAALEALAAEARTEERAGRLVPLALDVSDGEQLRSALSRAEALLGPLDGLVLAAAIAEHRPLDAIDAATIDAHFETNVRAPLLLTRDFALRARSGAAVVMLSSTLAERPALHTTMYAASKAAVIALTKSLALELAPRGIRVNALELGLVETDMIRELRLAPGELAPADASERRKREDAQLDALGKLAPIGRLMQPREVAPAVSYLLDEPLAFGTVLVLDGGLTL